VSSVLNTQPKPFPRNCYVVLHLRLGPPYPDPIASPQIAADAPFQLTNDIWIEKLDPEFAKLAQTACEPPNYNLPNEPYDRHLYAFVRTIPEKESSRNEGLMDLLTAVVLSRFVRPTSTGERYCAKVMPWPAIGPVIQALPLAGQCPDVFLGDNSRDWLSPDDGKELRRLMPWIPASKAMHPRVHRAYWNHEQAMRAYYLDTRWNLVVSGLESLITVEDRHVRHQFVRRVGKLSNEFTVDLSDQELHSAYTLRSKLAHAQSFLYGLHSVLPASEHRPLYDKLESLLRAVVRKCFLDEAFGNSFANDAAVRNWWP
jgi:hypothetical protein